MKNIHLEMIRITEASAIACFPWIGKGNKEAADEAATVVMRHRLNQIDFAGRIILSEGEKDNAPKLGDGEYVGKQSYLFTKIPASSAEAEQFEKEKKETKLYHIVVDPLDGTRNTSLGLNNAVSTLAVAYEGCFHKPNGFYMNKLAYGPKIADKVTIRITDSTERKIELAAMALRKRKSEVVVCILNRPRHEQIITELRQIGCTIKFINDCDVFATIDTCLSDIDLFLGIGGSTECLISASALKSLSGVFEAQECDNNGVIISDKIYGIEDLVKGSTIFVASGVTPGNTLKGVQNKNGRLCTNSILMRSESKTVRFIETLHGN